MRNPRKVIIVGSAYPLRGGGIATFNERLAKAYQDNGDHVIIYNFKLQYPGFLFPGKTQYSDEEPPEGLLIKTRINSINPLNWLRVGKEIREHNADLVIMRYWLPFMGPCLGTLARKIKKNRVSRIIAITDNVIPHEKRPGDKMLTRYFLKPVDGCVAMSRSVLNDLDRFDKKKPRELCFHPLYDNFGDPVPRDVALERLGMEKDWHYLLFFGFVRDYKGLDLLLEAFADSRLRQLRLKLIVAGEFYTDSQPYHEIVKKHGLTGRVIMDNAFIPNNEVYMYFCASDLVVQPYKEATQSGVTQVAYHFDKPMVVSNVGALPEMVPHNKVGYVVNPGVREIAGAILDYFKNNKMQMFEANIKEEKKKYSWENMISAIDALIQKIN
ncbi:MAG: glycosyltransferase [Bacteroidales bacterium]